MWYDFYFSIIFVFESTFQLNKVRLVSDQFEVFEVSMKKVPT